MDEFTRHNEALQCASSVAAAIGYGHDQEAQAQLVPMIEAFLVFKEREATRGGLWKEFGPEDSAMHMRSKATRIKFIVDSPQLEADAALDEALDIINYAAFFIRKARGSA